MPTVTLYRKRVNFIVDLPELPPSHESGVSTGQATLWRGLPVDAGTRICPWTIDNTIEIPSADDAVEVLDSPAGVAVGAERRKNGPNLR